MVSDKYKETWIDEDGNVVKIFERPSRIYSDKESRVLTNSYIIETCGIHSIPSSLGKGEYESFVQSFLKLSFSFGEIVGIENIECEKIYSIACENLYNFPPLKMLEEEGYLRSKKVMGKIILFPTAKLLENQRVEKKIIK